MASAGAQPEYPRERTPSIESTSKEKANVIEGDVELLSKDADDQAHDKANQWYSRARPVILTALAALILGWWISSTVLKATRGRWYAGSLFAFKLQLTSIF